MIKAKDIMTKEIITVSPDTEISQAAHLLLEKRDEIVHAEPEVAVETVCRTLEASARLFEPAFLEDLCSALVSHLVGDRPPPPSAGASVEFFDIWS